MTPKDFCAYLSGFPIGMRGPFQHELEFSRVNIFQSGGMHSYTPAGHPERAFIRHPNLNARFYNRSGGLGFLVPSSLLLDSIKNWMRILCTATGLLTPSGFFQGWSDQSSDPRHMHATVSLVACRLDMLYSGFWAAGS